MTLVSDPVLLRHRARLLTREALAASLRLIPPAAVDAVHTRWTVEGGRDRALLRPLAALLAHRPLDRTEVPVPGGHGERIAAVGSRLERRLWWQGERETVDAAWWRALCTGASDVLEVGAGVGHLSVIGASATHGRYTAVEANPAAAAALRRNLTLNGLGRAELVDAAVVGDGGVGEIELLRADRGTVRVRTVPAGPLFTGRDLVRVDLAGSDATVLVGAMNQIRRDRPTLLVRVPAGESRLHGVLRDLAADGYLIHTVGERLAPTSLSELRTAGDREVLLTPVERALPTAVAS